MIPIFRFAINMTTFLFFESCQSDQYLLSYRPKRRAKFFCDARYIKINSLLACIFGGSAFNGIWPGDGEVDPGFYSCLELDYPKCKHNKKNPESSLCVYHSTPKAGPDRTCDISGTADTHEFHLERIVKKCVEERSFPEIVDDDPHVNPYPDQPLGYFIVQMDKSTCHTYNLKEYFFGYRGVLTSRTTLLLEDIAEMYGVYILVVVQATHTFDINGCNALLYSAQKKRMRSFPAPLCTEHIVRDWKRACEEVCHSRTIQRCFMRHSGGMRTVRSMRNGMQIQKMNNKHLRSLKVIVGIKRENLGFCFNFVIFSRKTSVLWGK